MKASQSPSTMRVKPTANRRCSPELLSLPTHVSRRFELVGLAGIKGNARECQPSASSAFAFSRRSQSSPRGDLARTFDYCRPKKECKNPGLPPSSAATFTRTCARQIGTNRMCPLVESHDAECDRVTGHSELACARPPRLLTVGMEANGHEAQAAHTTQTHYHKVRSAPARS